MPENMGDPIRLKKGIHAVGIRSSLTPGRTNRVFSTLDGAPLKALEKYPLDVLEIGRNLPHGWDGGYFPAEHRITVLPSVSARTVRTCFRAWINRFCDERGEVGNRSDSTQPGA